MPDTTHHPLIIRAPYLGPDDRAEVAARSMAWSADMARDTLDEVVLLGGAIRELASMAKAPGTDVNLALKALAGAEAQLMAQLRVARVWAGLAGAYLSPEVRVALDRFEVA